MKSFVLILLVLTVKLSYATPVLFQDRVELASADGEHAYIISYTEEGQFVVDEFLSEPGRMQDRISSRTFTDLTEAIAHQKRIETKYSNWNRVADFSLSTQSESEGSSSRSISDENPSSHIWTASEEWSAEWEARFNSFVQTDFTQDFFVKYNIETDCADAAIALRFIFARNHKLPFGIRLAGSQTLFTHESLKRSWSHLGSHSDWHQDQKFLAALNYILDNTYTVSLSADSYPVKIDSQHLRPGVFLLSISGDGGHTRIISKTDYYSNANYPILLYSSTVPRAVRNLNREPFNIMGRPANFQSGFRAIRWLVKNDRGSWSLLNQESHTGYSMDQFADDFIGGDRHWAMAIFKRVSPDFSVLTALKEIQKGLISAFEARDQVVNDGYNICQQSDCSSGTANWNNWSTPSRDKHIKESIQAAKTFVILNGQARARWGRNISEYWEEVSLKDNVHIMGTRIELGQLIQVWESGRYSSDPNKPIQTRWGL